jgi:hypothetical protein
VYSSGGIVADGGGGGGAGAKYGDGGDQPSSLSTLSLCKLHLRISPVKILSSLLGWPARLFIFLYYFSLFFKFK